MTVQMNLNVVGVLLAFAGGCLIYSSGRRPAGAPTADTRQNTRATRVGIVMVVVGALLQLDVAVS